MKKAGEHVDEQLDLLSLGPSRYCLCYKGYLLEFSESIGVLMAKARLYDWTKHWEEQNEQHRKNLWIELKKVWELDEKRKEVTLSRIAKAEFKNKKIKWKQNYYSKYTTYEERVSHKPGQLTEQEWISLVEFWDTPAHIAISERNKANRAKLVGQHTNGRISFPRLIHDITEEEGAPPTLGDLYVRSRTSSRTNDVVDETSRAYIDRMRDMAGTHEDGNPLPLTNEIYRQVMPRERHGRVRLMGPGVTLSCYFGSRVAASEGNRLNRLNELETELAEMKRKEEERQVEIDKMKKKVQEKDEKDEKSSEKSMT